MVERIEKENSKNNCLKNICIVCEKELEEDDINFALKDASIHPIIYDGVVFRSRGNFGSTIWDKAAPFNKSNPTDHIQILICDNCLKQKSHIVNTFEKTTNEEGEIIYKYILFQDYLAKYGIFCENNCKKD